MKCRNPHPDQESGFFVVRHNLSAFSGRTACNSQGYSPSLSGRAVSPIQPGNFIPQTAENLHLMLGQTLTGEHPPK
jgi:hypothetical protein